MEKFVIKGKETGIIIDEFDSMMEAQQELKRYEESDKKDGIFIEDFYEISPKETKE